MLIAAGALLLSTVSVRGFVVNLQHQQLEELESIYLGSLTYIQAFQGKRITFD